MNINPNYQSIVKGAIIVGALALDSFTARLAYRKVARPEPPQSAGTGGTAGSVPGAVPGPQPPTGMARSSAAEAKA